MNTDLYSKVARAGELIQQAAKRWPRACVLWSGGKDSMVLLHLLRNVLQEGTALPVVCYREPWMPAKLAFANRIIAEWHLTAWDYPPFKMALCKGNGRIDVIEHFNIGHAPMMLARGTEPLERVSEDGPTPGEGVEWLCGRDTFLSRPLGNMAFPWDAMYIGHKSSDVDPTSGGIPLALDIKDTPGTAASIYPLRDWTDDDVFAYIEHFEVPYDEARYGRDPETGAWTILKDIKRNPDYYRACFTCCDPDAGDFVSCPKLGRTINSIAGMVEYVSPSMPYCGLRTEPAEGGDGK